VLDVSFKILMECSATLTLITGQLEFSHMYSALFEFFLMGWPQSGQLMTL
jgi:hypothetical protein